MKIDNEEEKRLERREKESEKSQLSKYKIKSTTHIDAHVHVSPSKSTYGEIDIPDKLISEMLLY